MIMVTSCFIIIDDDDDDGDGENNLQQVVTFPKFLKHVLQNETARANHMPCPHQKLICMALLGYPANKFLFRRHSIPAKNQPMNH